MHNTNTNLQAQGSARSMPCVLLCLLMLSAIFLLHCSDPPGSKEPSQEAVSDGQGRSEGGLEQFAEVRQETGVEPPGSDASLSEPSVSPEPSIGEGVADATPEPSVSPELSPEEGMAERSPEVEEVFPEGAASEGTKESMGERVPEVVSEAGSCVAPAGNNNYYVDNQGRCGACSDTYTKAQNSITQPWCTVKKATALLQAGDRVYIRAGTYKEGVSIKTGGSAGKPIVYASFPGERAVVEAGIPIHIEVDYVQIEGLRLVLSSFYGVRVVNAAHIVLKDNQLYSLDRNDSKCIYLNGSSDVLVEGNDISFTSDGIHTTGRAVNLTIRGNRIIGREAVFPAGAHPDGLQMRSSPVNNVKILNNTIKHGTSANLFIQAIGSGPWQDVTVAGNLLIQDGDGLAGKHIHFVPIAGLRIECNTMVTLSANGTGYTHGINVGASTNVTVQNNIFYNSLYFFSSSFVSDYNLHYQGPKQSKRPISNMTLAQFQQANPGKEVHSVSGDPLFVDLAKDDFRLQAGSPGRDKGTACSATATDLKGRSRPQGQGWDIGAYE